MKNADYSGKWVQTSVTCDVCSHTQQSVYPAVCASLECGGCGYMMVAPRLPVRFDADGMPDGLEESALYAALEGVLFQPEEPMP